MQQAGDRSLRNVQAEKETFEMVVERGDPLAASIRDFCATTGRNLKHVKLSFPRSMHKAEYAGVLTGQLPYGWNDYGDLLYLPSRSLIDAFRLYVDEDSLDRVVKEFAVSPVGFVTPTPIYGT